VILLFLNAIYRIKQPALIKMNCIGVQCAINKYLNMNSLRLNPKAYEPITKRITKRQSAGHACIQYKPEQLLIKE